MVQPVNEQDPQHVRRRTFAKAFVKRLKTIDKAMADLKHVTPMEEENKARKYVRCSECFKKRPILAGVDLSKIPTVRTLRRLLVALHSDLVYSRLCAG